jgi:histidyl-tRNA synthetase
MKEQLSAVSALRLDSGHALRILDSKLDQDIEVLSLIKSDKVIDDFTTDNQRDGFNEVLNLLTAFDIPWKRNHKLVRGLDYYNGTSFEVKASNTGSLGPSQSTLLAGGRYDYLA